MTVDERDIVRYLHMGGTKPDAALSERIAQLCDQAVGEIRPACTWKRFSLSGEGITSGGLTLRITEMPALHLHGCGSAYLMCGTLGAGFDMFMRKMSAISSADALIIQAIGTAAVERLMDSVEDEIRSKLPDGETLTPRYSPGYGDFPLSAQRTVLSLLDASRKAGISLTDTLLMAPSKSVSAISGVRSL